MSDFEEMKTNLSARNDFEDSLQRRRQLLHEERLRAEDGCPCDAAADAAAADAADAFCADGVPTPDQVFSDTDDGF